MFPWLINRYAFFPVLPARSSWCMTYWIIPNYYAATWMPFMRCLAAASINLAGVGWHIQKRHCSWLHNVVCICWLRLRLILGIVSTRLLDSASCCARVIIFKGVPLFSCAALQWNRVYMYLHLWCSIFGFLASIIRSLSALNISYSSKSNGLILLRLPLFSLYTAFYRW